MLERGHIAKAGVVVLVVIVALILNNIYLTTDVAIHVTTERLTFSVPDFPPGASLIESLPVSFVSMAGPKSIALDVDSIVAQGHQVPVPENRLVLSSLPGTTARLRISADPLRLMRLGLVGSRRVSLYRDGSGDLVVTMQSPTEASLEFTVPDIYTLDTSDFRLSRGASDPSDTTGIKTQQRFVVRAALRSLVLAHSGDGALDIVIRPRAAAPRPDITPDIRLEPNLRISAVNFVRSQDTAVVSAVTAIRIEPFFSDDKFALTSFVILKDKDVFTLRSVRLTGNGLDCVIVGRTNAIRIGNSNPYPNVVPSVLSSLLSSRSVEKVIEILKAFWK